MEAAVDPVVGASVAVHPCPFMEAAVDPVVGELTQNPLLYPLHDDPRFQALRERVGLAAVNQ